MKYQVLAGQHREGGKTYNKGDVVDSKTNLLRLNADGLDPKFRRVEEDGNVAVANDGLDEMTVDDLKAFAAEEEIDLGKATRKEDIVSAIRKHI